MDGDLKKSLIETLAGLCPKKEETPHGWTKVASVLNAPVTITVIGGAILAIISGLVSHWSAQSTKERELAVERLRQKQAFVATFSTSLERELVMTFSVRKREIFLRDWQHIPAEQRLPYPDGRDFTQTRDQWEKEKKAWLAQNPNSAIGLIFTAKALFRQPVTRERLNDLYRAFDAYGKATNNIQLNAAYHDALARLEQVCESLTFEAYEK